MTQVARELRQRETPAEVTLWEALRDRRLGGLKFRRQHPVAATAFVADFLCYEARLIIELDGGAHIGQERADADRTAALHELGYQVIRFRNERIADDLETVLHEILIAAAPQRLTQRGKSLSEGESLA
ncbi:MAG: DUF559 domain-containing protein [Chloroflexi bacterium]|nr:DUF559 domain-containing protein [Chloroflexota bacterium]